MGVVAARLITTGCLGTALLLAGCQSAPPLFSFTRVTTSEEVGNVFVSAYPAVPWEDVRDRLEPKHNLTIEQARGLAAQSTQARISQFLSTFAIGLGLGLPNRIDTTTTEVAAGGTETTTSSRTRGTGTVPSASGAASTAIADAALASDFSKIPGAVGVDAVTQIMGGTAIYQLARILDSQITKAIYPKGYRVHLVTIQVNLQPQRRDLPYDAYINVSLLPGSWKQALATSTKLETDAAALPPVMVYPLVISDAMESSNVGRSIEIMRQAALSLAGIVGRTGVNLGIGGGSDNLDAVIGQDRNSLVTVGRVSDHTVRIRLGAQYSASSGAATVPRTTNVSLVVLTRWGGKGERIDTLSAITETTFASSEDGVLLRSGRARSREALAIRVAEAVEAYEFGPVQAVCAGDAIPDKATPTILQRRGRLDESKADKDTGIHLNLLRAVDRSDFNFVKKCLALPDPLKTQDEVRFRRLLADLIEIQNSSRFSKLLIHLGDIPDPAYPDPAQIVVANDDGKNSTTLTLRNGKGLKPDNVRAALLFLGDPSRPERRILPTAITVGAGGTQLNLQFPSLAVLKLEEGGAAAKKLSLWLDIDGATKPRSLNYALHILALPLQEPKRLNPVKAPTTVLVADQSGIARLSVSIGKYDDAVAKAGPLFLAVSGADVREDKALGSVGLTHRGIPLKPESVVTLLLGNVTLAKQVTLTTLDAQDKQVGDALVLDVERVVHAR